MTGAFNEEAIFEDTMKTPVGWWEYYGSEAPELQAIALVVLSQVCDVGAAERNWKVFSWIHDRRRNRLSKDRAEKLVRLHYNLRIINKLKNNEWEEEMHAPFQLDDSAGGV